MCIGDRLQRVYGLPMASMLETYGEEFEGAFDANASATRAGAAPAGMARARGLKLAF